MKRKLFEATGYFDSENGVYAEVKTEAQGRLPGFSATMDIDQFCQAVTGATIERKDKEISFSLGEIPPNLWSVKTKLSSSGQIKAMTAVFAIPGQKARFNLDTKLETFDGIIPWPKMVFIAEARSGHSSGLYTYCYIDSVLTKDTKLYHYPFGNVYMDGRVCMGGYYQKVESLMGLYDYVDAFYKMKTNNDLRSTESSKFHCSQKNALEMISKLDTFPNEYLVATGRTLKSVLPKDL